MFFRQKNQSAGARSIGPSGIHYFAMSARKRHQANQTKKRHISAGKTERWRFWLVICFSALLLIALNGAWQELTWLIP